MTEYKNFIDDAKLLDLIEKSSRPDSRQIDEILAKALELKGISLEDVANLLNVENEDDLQKIFNTALKIKQEIYGNRLVLFAPLYVSNYCSNWCKYCAFRAPNKDLHRSVLTPDEVVDETKAILDMGHKRILMLMGENSNKCSLEYFISLINKAYSVRNDKGSNIRRINIEIAPLSEDEFHQLTSETKIGTYTVFQETYHKETYKEMHPQGKKADYNWRLTVMDRALSNGLNDVGIGALFGLFDYRFEVLGLISHAHHMDEMFGVGPHTISFPRINPAQNAPASHDLKYKVSDRDFKKIIAIVRMAVPYTGMILSTRESIKMRNELIDMGISQISAASKTSVGGYADHKGEVGQFTLDNDDRTPDQMIHDMIEAGFVPSFCTGCYRMGRVGADFMELAKPGLIKMHCLPNALSTLKEFLVDYADPDTKKLGEQLIEKEIHNIPNPMRQEQTREYLKRIEAGERDLYF